MSIALQWHRVMEVDDLWDGDLVGVKVAGNELILISIDGDVRAYHNRCPHQASLLSDGDLDGFKLTCPAHMWEFDARTGEGINPGNCRLADYPVRIEDGAIHVGLP